jgi:hypothetical protein
LCAGAGTSAGRPVGDVQEDLAGLGHRTAEDRLMRTETSSTRSLSMPGTRSIRAATIVESSPIRIVNSASTLSISGSAASNARILSTQFGVAASPMSWSRASRPRR